MPQMIFMKQIKFLDLLYRYGVLKVRLNTSTFQLMSLTMKGIVYRRQCGSKLPTNAKVVILKTNYEIELQIWTFTIKL